MARITQQELERIKTEVSLQGLVEARGIELRKHGSTDLIGLCPFHDDHDPSLVVTPTKNLWHCLGACQQGGSVIDWVMKAEGISFRHAVEFLKEGAPKLSTGPAPAKSTTKKLPSPVSNDVEDQQLLHQVVDYYHSTLKQSPEAHAYLEKRALKSSELIDTFKLGFANRTLGYRMPDRNRNAGKKLRERLIRLGIYRESGHEHFNGSLIVPIFDESGRVSEIYGRKVTHNLRRGTPDHLYLPGPHRGVWNLDSLKASKEIILCESLIDAMTFWVHGYRNVTCSYGIEGFTKDHQEAFDRHGIKRVLIAYDHDAGGDRAADKLARELIEGGIECFRIVFPRGIDANELAVTSTNPTDALGRVIRSAKWIGKPKATFRQAPPVPVTPTPENQTAATKEQAPPPGDVFSLAADDADPLTSPVPSFAQVEAEVETKSDDELQLTIGDRRWRVRGLSKVTSFDLLKVNVLVARLDMHGNTTDFHIDTLDLYSHRARATFTKAAADEIGISEDIIKRDLGRVLLACEAQVEELIRKTLEPQSNEVVLSEDEERNAIELLKDPNLLERILADFEAAGVIGEQTNKLVGYLTAVSRKLEEPLAVVVQSSSAAGKSSLMEAILAFIPEEERIKFSAMTGQSLFYMGEQDLNHKVLAIVEEEGAERAAYALKLLQSEGELSIASTGKDPSTGRLVTHEYRVKGPVAIFLTTTAIEIDEELLSRCIVLTVDEDREQTRAIHRLQRERQTLPGLMVKQQRDRVLKLHQDAQRLLKPILVANPYARWLTFADERIRNRRDHMKYLTLIRSIALLHQHQRRRKVAYSGDEEFTYIEVTTQDIRLANRLAHEVLGRSLDELAPQTRRLLLLVDEMVTKACARLEVERSDYRFTRKDVRRHTGWTDFQVRVHLDRLAELEYLLVHRGGRGQSFVYELIYDGKGIDGRPFMVGLTDPDELERLVYDNKFEGSEPKFEVQEGNFKHPTSPQAAPIEPLKRTVSNGSPPGLLDNKALSSSKSTSRDKDLVFRRT